MNLSPKTLRAGADGIRDMLTSDTAELTTQQDDEPAIVAVTMLARCIENMLRAMADNVEAEISRE